MARTYVIPGNSSDAVQGSVWSVHRVVAGVWLAIFFLISFGSFGWYAFQNETMTNLLDLQARIQSTGQVHTSGVFVGMQQRWGEPGSAISFLKVNAIWKEWPVDPEEAANRVGELIYYNFPGYSELDLVEVTITYGYDIGIASSWRRAVFQFSPGEMGRRLAVRSGSPRFRS